ncbi:radical SAM protein [Patescibacteria group bacterium]|nr:radical SAM protein [Patescibacteria group bacterium]
MKKDVKVLLVQPNYQERKFSKDSISPPLGLAYIASVLEKNGIDVEILDANVLNLDADDVVQRAISTGATVIGVGILMGGYKYSIEIAQKLPKNILSVAGGAYASSAPEKVLQNGFDIAVKGRGEYVILEIALGKPLKDIPGIFYWENNKIVIASPRLFENFKSAPLLRPARHLLISNGVNKPYRLVGTMYFPWSPIFTSIGCPYQCYWCSKQVFNRFLPREPKEVIVEIDELVKKYKVKEIDIYDDCFNADIQRAEKILDLIIENKLNVKLRFVNGIRVNGITRPFMEKMKKAGCIEVAYGIESGDQEVLDRIPKMVLLEEIRRAIKYTKEAGILTVGFFILGLQGDNKKTMQKTIDFAKEIGVDVAFFSILTPYPGTRLWNLIEKEGKFLIRDFDDLYHNSGKMAFSHPDFPSADLVEKIYKKAYRDFYFSPKYIVKHLLALRSWRQLTLNLRGFSSIIYTQIKG